MIPTQRQIQNEIRKLRVIVENSGNAYILARLAYTVEHALRWAIEDTEGWPRPSIDVFHEADILKTELKCSKRKA